IYGVFLASVSQSNNLDAGFPQKRVELILMEQCTYSFYDELEEFGPAGEESAARIMTSVFAALAYIHDQGIVHRDVKAANILISATDRRVLLSDFGMAVQPAVEENINWMSGTPGHI
ncbi:unnamed protein product, partial [Polarella glacialis]